MRNAPQLGLARVAHPECRRSGESHPTCGDEPGHYHKSRARCTARGRKPQLRRSACQTPAQRPLPPLQEPPPALPLRWPVPTAVLSPALTLTTTAPCLSTLPVIL